jgi:hypothetical protein
MAVPLLAERPSEVVELEIWRDGRLITRAEMEAAAIAIEDWLRKNSNVYRSQDKG